MESYQLATHPLPLRRFVYAVISVFTLLLAGCGEPRPLVIEPGRPPQARPTQRPLLELGGSDVTMSMRFPGDVQNIDLAVHPNIGWPAVIVVQGFDFSTDPFRVYARVYNPKAHRWGVGQQIDVGAASLGRPRQPIPKAVIAVTADDTVTAVWGSGGVLGGIWTSSTSNYGDTWSAPQKIADQCWFATSMAATPDGQIVVLASCQRSQSDPDGAATLIIRQASGTWQAPEYLPIWSWCGTVVIAGDGPDALASVLTVSHAAGTNTQTMTILSKYLVNRGWAVATKPIPPTGETGEGAASIHCNFRSSTFPRQYPGGTVRTGAIVTWTMNDHARVLAMTAFDSRLQWSDPQTAVFYPGMVTTTHQYVTSAVPAYDVTADRLVLIWGCCGWFARKETATQYSHWSVPESGVWHGSLQADPATPPDPAPDSPTPLVLGGLRVGAMAAQFAANSRKTWIAWLEGRQELIVRSFELNQLIPVSQYPAATPVPTP